jgi:hypothetical protein
MMTAMPVLLFRLRSFLADLIKTYRGLDLTEGESLGWPGRRAPRPRSAGSSVLETDSIID